MLVIAHRSRLAVRLATSGLVAAVIAPPNVPTAGAASPPAAPQTRSGGVPHTIAWFSGHGPDPTQHGTGAVVATVR